MKESSEWIARRFGRASVGTQFASGLGGNGRNDFAGALAEADAGQAGRLAITAEDYFITVFEKCAGLAGRQFDRFGAVFHLEETAFGAFLGSGDGAGCEQVAGRRLQPLLA